jgi:hypothetical protein
MSVATARGFGVRVVVALALALGALASPAGLAAQGVTTGAVRGRVTDTSGQPIAGVNVQVVNAQTGARFGATTNASGTFFIPNVLVGMYTVEARIIGYRPGRKVEVSVNLGLVADASLQLEPATVEVAAIEVTGRFDNDLLAPSRTGPVASVSENLIQNLPSINRNFTDFTNTSSLVNSNSIAGQADRYNSLQIDGGSNSDLFGLNSSRGIPGGANRSRPLSVEAVEQYQILIAPFDVRQGGFTGGLVNAVTRSGTNQFHGSVFGYYQDQGIVGKDSLGNSASDFDLRYYGFSLGGPIVRDRLHFFTAAEWRQSETPFSGIVIGTDTTNGADSVGVGIRRATAERVRSFAINTLGWDPGDYGRPIIPNPDQNFFAKLTAQIGARGQAELSYNYVRSNADVLVHDPTGANPTRLREGYQYDQSGYDRASATDSWRGRLNTPFGGRYTNELIVSRNTINDERQMGNRRPVLIVGADRRNTAAACAPLGSPVVTTGCPTTFLALGGERFSHANLLDQNVLEIADNLTIDLGAHVVTVGGRYERFKFLNVFFPASLGAWFFADTTAFFNRTPSRYELALPGSYVDSVNGRTDGPIADFTFNQTAFYLQDNWRPSRGLTMTLGLRADFTSLPAPAYNPRIDSALVIRGPNAGKLFGVRTDNIPTDALLISPRLGVNYDVNGDGSFMLRGGVGVFSGRTPYVWASNAYTNTGLEQVQLTCTVTTGIPTFTDDPDNQPTACPTGGLAAATPAIVYFDTDFKLPQNLRASLGLDYKLPWDMVGSFDALYTRALNQFILEDVNLVPGGIAIGEANRQMYGTMSGTSSTATPRRATAAARDVLRQFNSNEDWSVALTFQLNKRFSDNLEFAAGYTWSRSMDLISPTSDISNSLLNFSTLDGTFASRNLARSFFDQPHSVRVSGTAGLPYGLRFSMFYRGFSGRPYAYRYSSDVNADGFSGNDLFYVPLNAQDISLATPSQYGQLDAFINGEPCLREQRGRIMERNSCRNPWQGFIDARLAKTFSTFRGQSIEVAADMFNLLSFLGVGGQVRETSSFETQTIASLSRYDNSLGRGVYNLALPVRNRVDVSASRWKLQLGARYAF